MDVLSVYPFLQPIYDRYLVHVDLNALYLPDEQERVILHDLLERLPYNIVLYKHGFAPQGEHLCQTIQSARIQPAELQLLQSYERLFAPGKVIVVAYDNPVRLFKEVSAS